MDHLLSKEKEELFEIVLLGFERSFRFLKYSSLKTRYCGYIKLTRFNITFTIFNMDIVNKSHQIRIEISNRWLN